MARMTADKSVLVTGAGGFIGGYLVKALLEDGAHVRAVDCKPLDRWRQRFGDAENIRLDLRDRDACVASVRGVERVYNLAADVGGVGYLQREKARCMLSVLINTHLLLAARDAGVGAYFYASSACVYSAAKQQSASIDALRETDAYPAMPEDGYGWEKLFGER